MKFVLAVKEKMRIFKARQGRRILNQSLRNLVLLCHSRIPYSLKQKHFMGRLKRTQRIK
jgi:hypothetical protein